MKIIFAGTPHNAAQTLEALIAGGVEIAAVLTRTDAEVGRSKKLTPSPVALVAQEHGIKTLKYNQVDATALDAIKSVSADLGVVVAYGALLKLDVLKALPKGWINLHYSLLPGLRGAAPVQHAILNGLATTGVSIFKLDEGMDTGPIISTVETKIEVGENSAHLLSRLTQLGISALLETLPSIAAGFAQEMPQDHTAKTFAPKINRDAARISWQDPAKQIENLVNAMNPEPMAWTIYNGDPIRVLAARALVEAAVDSPAGSVSLLDGKPVVAAGKSTCLEIIQVQPSGKQAMPAPDWYRGQASKGSVVFE